MCVCGHRRIDHLDRRCMPRLNWGMCWIITDGVPCPCEEYKEVEDARTETEAT